MDADETLVVEDANQEDSTDEESRDEPREHCAVLHVPSQKGFKGADFKLYRGLNKIGRSSEVCTVFMPVQALSQQHACIEIRRATEVDLVYDLKSRNGTKRGKMRLEPEVRYELRHGDTLYLADLECRYDRVVIPSVRSKDLASTGVTVPWQNPSFVDASAECFSDSDESIDMLQMAEDAIEPSDSPCGIVADSMASSPAAVSPNGEEALSSAERTRRGGEGGGDGSSMHRSALGWQQSTPIRPADREDDIFCMATQAYTMPVNCTVNELDNESDSAGGIGDSLTTVEHPDDQFAGAKVSSRCASPTTAEADTVTPAAPSSQETGPRRDRSREGDAIGSQGHNPEESFATTPADAGGSDNAAYEAETQPYAAAASVEPSTLEPLSKGKLTQPALRRVASESDNESTLLISDIEDNEPPHLEDEPVPEEMPDGTFSGLSGVTTECKPTVPITDAEEMIVAGMIGSPKDAAPQPVAGSALCERHVLASNGGQVGLPPPSGVVAVAGRDGVDRCDKSPDQEACSVQCSSRAGSRKRRSHIPLPLPPGSAAKRSRSASRSASRRFPLSQLPSAGSPAAAEGDYVASSSLEGRNEDDDESEDGGGNDDDRMAASLPLGAAGCSSLPVDASCCAKNAVALDSAADVDTLPYVEDDAAESSDLGSRAVSAAMAANDLASSPLLPTPASGGRNSLLEERSAPRPPLAPEGEAALAPAASQELPTLRSRRAGRAAAAEAADACGVRATAMVLEVPGLPGASAGSSGSLASGDRAKRCLRGKRSVTAAGADAGDSSGVASAAAAAEQCAAARSSRRSDAAVSGLGLIAGTSGSRRSSAAAAADSAADSAPAPAAADKPGAGKRSSSSRANGARAAKRPLSSSPAVGALEATADEGKDGGDSMDGRDSIVAAPDAQAAVQVPQAAAFRHSASAGGAAGTPDLAAVGTPGRAAAGRRGGRAPTSMPVTVDHGEGPCEGADTTEGAETTATAAIAAAAPGDPSEATGVRGRRRAAGSASVSLPKGTHSASDYDAALAMGKPPEADAESSKAADFAAAVVQNLGAERAAADGRPVRSRRRQPEAVAAGSHLVTPVAETAATTATASGSDGKKVSMAAHSGCPAASSRPAGAAKRQENRSSSSGDGRGACGTTAATAAAVARVDSSDDGSVHRRPARPAVVSPSMPAAMETAPAGKRLLVRAGRRQPSVAVDKVEAEEPERSSLPSAVKVESAATPAAGSVPVPASKAGPPSTPENGEEEKDKRSGRLNKSHAKQDAAAAEVLPAESPLSAQSALTLRISKPKIMFTGISDCDYQEIIKRLGGSLVDSVSQCTHLVTDEVRRTLKFLCCVTRGIPIVTPQWLAESNKASSFLDATQFLLRDKAKENLYGFSLPESLERARSAPLLKDYKVYATKSVKPPPEQIKDIVTLAGGTYIKGLPKHGSGASPTILVSCTEDLALCKAAAATSGVAVVTTEFLLTGVLQQRVDVNAYSLSR